MFEFCEAHGGGTKISCDIEEMAWSRTGSKERLAARNCAGEDYVGEGNGRFSKIASSERDFVCTRQREKTVKELVEPFAGKLFGQSE